jgi:hypothetical protein
LINDQGQTVEIIWEFSFVKLGHVE